MMLKVLIMNLNLWFCIKVTYLVDIIQRKVFFVNFSYCYNDIFGCWSYLDDQRVTQASSLNLFGYGCEGTYLLALELKY